MQRIASLVVVLGALVNNGLGASCSATDGGCSGATRDDGGCGASCDAGCCESLANADCFGCGWRVHANSLVWTRDIQNSAELVQPRMAGEAFNLADARSIDDFGFDYESGMEVGIARFFFKCGYPAEMAFTFRYIDSWESKFGGTFAGFADPKFSSGIRSDATLPIGGLAPGFMPGDTFENTYSTDLYDFALDVIHAR
jgi:hypothetical protein